MAKHKISVIAPTDPNLALVEAGLAGLDYELDVNVCSSVRRDNRGRQGRGRDHPHAAPHADRGRRGNRHGPRHRHRQPRLRPHRLRDRHQEADNGREQRGLLHRGGLQPHDHVPPGLRQEPRPARREGARGRMEDGRDAGAAAHRRADPWNRRPRQHRPSHSTQGPGLRPQRNLLRSLRPDLDSEGVPGRDGRQSR